MSQSFKLNLSVEGYGEVSKECELSDTEESMLHQYLIQYEELSETRPLREGLLLNFHLQVGVGEPCRVDANIPDSDTLSIILHRMRPFILQNELANYSRVKGLIARKFDDANLKDFFSAQQRLYDGRKSQEIMRISSDDVIINSEKVFLDWLNSHEYHRDTDKRKTIDELFAQMPGDSMRFLLVSMVVDKIMAVQNIAAFVKLLLGKEDKLHVNV